MNNWYPDNSGEWVEYNGFNQPSPMQNVDVLLRAERRDMRHTVDVMRLRLEHL